MVPMARILVVGVVFIAAPCAFAELKPKRQPISASAATRANFMSSPFNYLVLLPGQALEDMSQSKTFKGWSGIYWAFGRMILLRGCPRRYHFDRAIRDSRN